MTKQAMIFGYTQTVLNTERESFNKKIECLVEKQEQICNELIKVLGDIDFFKIETLDMKNSDDNEVMWCGYKKDFYFNFSHNKIKIKFYLNTQNKMVFWDGLTIKDMNISDLKNNKVFVKWVNKVNIEKFITRCEDKLIDFIYENSKNAILIKILE